MAREANGWDRTHLVGQKCMHLTPPHPPPERHRPVASRPMQLKDNRQPPEAPQSRDRAQRRVHALYGPFWVLDPVRAALISSGDTAAFYATGGENRTRCP